MHTERWAVIDTGMASAEHNMAIDAHLLDSLSTSKINTPILHLYDWNAPSATYGYFTDPYKLLNQDTVARSGLCLARRPTGGGVIFHLSDVAFSMVVPASHPGYSLNVLDNYAFVNNIVIEAVKRFSAKKVASTLLTQEIQPCTSRFCMAKPTKYDVVFEGRKVSGGAQRRTKYGFLHQGSISLAIPDETFLHRLLLDGDILDQMKATTYMLLSECNTKMALKEAQSKMCRVLVDVVSEMGV